MRFYLGCIGLCIYTLFALLYLASVWIIKRTIFQTPLLVFYVMSMVLVNMMIAFPRTDVESKIPISGERVVFEIMAATTLFCLDVYFFAVLCSLYILMRREELDALRGQQQ